MIQLNIILAAIFCATSTMHMTAPANPPTEQTVSNYRLGKNVVETVRVAFEKGEYDAFLKEMDVAYQMAQKEGKLDPFIEMRKKEIPEKVQSEWEDKIAALQAQKRSELLKVLQVGDNSIFAEKVRSVASEIAMPEEEKAIAKLHMFVQMAPESGKNKDENQLIDIDIEYEYKIHYSGTSLSHLPSNLKQEHQMALRMEKMKKMNDAARYFTDLSLKQTVGLAAVNFDVRMARNLDGNDLNNIVSSKINPANELEKKVFAIISSSQEKFKELMKEIASQVN